jgi:hypothetical protein
VSILIGLRKNGSLSSNEFGDELATQREFLRSNNGWNLLAQRLNFDTDSENWYPLETLHLLANSSKHSPAGQPEEKLIKHLKLDANRTYAPFVESNCFQEGLAASVHLAKDSPYTEIADKMLELAGGFLQSVRGKNTLSDSETGVLSLMKKDDFAC